MSVRPVIALDALLVGSQPTGVGRSILELAKALAYADRGFDFTLLVTHPEPFARLSKTDHWQIEVCPEARGSSLRKAIFTQGKLPGLCRKLGVDLLHSLQFVTPLRSSCPRVVTVHDLAWKSYAGLLQTSRKLYYDIMVPRSLRAAAAIVTNSESTTGDVRAFVPELAERVHTTPFGTPSWVWDMDQEMPRNSPSSDDAIKGPYFLFVGTLEPRKNLERLLSAYGAFRKECNDKGLADDTVPTMLLAGARGWNDNQLRRKIESLQSLGLLKVLDYCSVTRLWELYRGAVGLVFPSLHEGFGFPILEAMAAGCPVLTSGRGAMQEVGGQAAIYVVPEDETSICRGLHELAWGGERNTERSQLGFAQARKWDWERTAATTCAVYQRILNPS